MNSIYKWVPKGKACLCVFLNILTLFIRIAMIRVLAVLFDDIIARRMENMPVYVTMFVALAVLVRILNYFNATLSNEIGLEIYVRSHTSFYKSILNMEVPQAQSEFTASIAQRHLSRIEGYLPQKYVNLVVEIIRLVMALVYIGIVSWQLLLFSVTVFPVILIVTGMLGGKIEQLNQSILQGHKEIDNMCMEALDGAESIRIHNAGSFLKDKFAKRLADVYEVEKKLEKKQKMINEPLLTISSFILNIVYIFWSGLLSYWGIMSTGSVISLIGFYSNIINPIMFFMNYSVSKKSVVPSLDTVNGIIQFEEDTQPDGIPSGDIPHTTGLPIEMRGVDFSYNEHKPVLNSFEMRAESGNIISIRGESGSGKSTILDLICGFLRAEKGDILYWGNRAEEIGIRAVRRKMAYVSQTPFLFSESVLANLSYIREDITISDIREINRECEGLFDELEDYYEEPIGDFGEKLSGGMKQKLDVLRLLVSDADIYIMDEPSSALDAVSRSKLAQILRRKREEGKTIIMVTHQDSIGGLADREYTISSKNRK